MPYHNNYGNDQAAGLRKLVTKKPVRVIAITGGKGGIGKTSITANLAVAMANKGKNVMVLDADYGLANLDIVFGLQPKFNLSHVLQGNKSLEEIILSGPSGIHIIPAASGIQAMAELSHQEHIGLIRAFSDLKDTPDVLLIDTSAGISDSVISLCKASHEVVIVVCDEPASITDAYAMIKLLNKEYGIQKYRVITNMVDSYNSGLNLYKKFIKVTDHFLDVALDYMGAIPNDEYLKKAIQKQTPVVNAYPRSKSAIAFNKYVEKIDKWPLPNYPTGDIEFFLEQLYFHKHVELAAI